LFRRIYSWLPGFIKRPLKFIATSPKRLYKHFNIKRKLRIIRYFFDFIALLVIRKITVRELISLMPIVGKRFMKVRDAINENIIKKTMQQQPITASDLMCVVSFKFMNQKEKNITDCICDAINSKELKEEYKQKVEQIKEMLEIEIANLSALWLTDIESVAIAGCLYVLAYDIRAISVRKILKYYESKNKVRYLDTKKLYSIYFNKGEYEKAKNIIKKAGMVWRRHNYGDIDLMFAITNIKEQGLQALNNISNNTNGSNKVFAETIKNKKIALIGPAANTLNIEEIANSYDIKVNMTYQGKEHLSDSIKQCGIDISYYNVQHVDKFINNNKNMEFFNDLKMAAFKGIKHNIQKKLVQKKRARRLCINNIGILMYQGAGNMAQLTLIDLMLFSPAKIKLYNINLFLSKQAEAYHKGYYNDNAGWNLEELWRSDSSKHNLISNYELLQALYRLGCFEADEKLAEIIALGAREYMQQLEILRS